MSFDTLIEGNAASVQALASWVTQFEIAVKGTVSDTEQSLKQSGSLWQGRAAEGYRAYAKDLIQVAERIAEAASEVADRFSAYGQQLGWRQEDMAQHRARAAAGGLIVSGTIVEQPPVAMRPPPIMTGPDPDPAILHDYNQREAAYNEALRKQELYAEVKSRVSNTYDTLDEWIAVNLVTDGISEAVAPSGVMASGVATSAEVLGITLDASTTVFEKRSEQIMAAAVARATRDAGGRSGNPAVRSGDKAPHNENIQKRLDRRKAPQTSKTLLKWSKRLGLVGTVVTVASAGYELAGGASPSSLAVEAVGGAVGGAIGGAIGAKIGLAGGPVGVAIGAAAGGVVGGLIGSTAAVWGYETLVPLATRDKIDEGIRDTFTSVAGTFGFA